MTASRRTNLLNWRGVAALLLVALAQPAIAQNADAPIDVTAAPPPSAETVGPAQLRNFQLNGTVTRSADRPAATTGNQPAIVAPAPSRAANPADNPAFRAATVDRSVRAGSSRDLNPTRQAASALPASPPSIELTGPATDAITQPAVDVAAPLPIEVPPAQPSRGFPSWPWIAALVALIGGGAFLIRARRGQRERDNDLGRLAFAGPLPEVQPDWPKKSPPPQPAPIPRNHPIPPRADTPRAAPKSDPAPPRPVSSGNGTITSTGLKPELNVQFTPDRAVVTDNEVMLQFDMLIVNSGSAPARDVLVEATMVCAHAGQDAEIAEFFQRPAGSGDRMAAIPPLGRVNLKSAVRLPLDQVKDFEVEGRRLFVPLTAFNVHFRSGSGEGQASASFLVGRGSEADEKLAPFRLDLGPRIFRGLSTRAHSMGLTR